MNLDILREWIEKDLGIETIFEHPNAPRPLLPYCTLQVINENRIGLPYRSPVDENGECFTFRDSEITVSVNVYIDEEDFDPRVGLGKAIELRNKLDLISTRNLFFENQFAVRRIESLNDTTTLINNRFEPRASFDIIFGTRTKIHDTLGVIEEVGIDGNIDPMEIQETIGQ